MLLEEDSLFPCHSLCSLLPLPTLSSLQATKASSILILETSSQSISVIKSLPWLKLSSDPHCSHGELHAPQGLALASLSSLILMAPSLKLYALVIPNFSVAPTLSLLSLIPYYLSVSLSLSKLFFLLEISFQLFPHPHFFPIWINLIHLIRLFCATSFRKSSLILLQIGGLLCSPGKIPLSFLSPLGLSHS